KLCLACAAYAGLARPCRGTDVSLSNSRVGIAIALQRRLPMTVASYLVRIATRFANSSANVGVARIGPETTSPLRLDVGVSRTPFRVNAKSYQRVAYCSAVCMPIELH